MAVPHSPVVAPALAAAIEAGVDAALYGGHTTADLGGTLSTSEVGDWIAQHVKSGHV